MGVFYERFRRKRLLLALGAIPAIFPAVVIGTGRVDAIVASLVLVGFFNDFGISMMYAFLVDLEGSDPTSYLAVVNTFNMLIGMWVAPMLSLGSTISWSFGWALVGTIPLIPIGLLILVKGAKLRSMGNREVT